MLMLLMAYKTKATKAISKLKTSANVIMTEILSWAPMASKS